MLTPMLEGSYNNKDDNDSPNKLKQPSSATSLQNMVRALMAGYLRKQQQPMGGPPLTSAAPPDILDSFKPLDRYGSFGVPYTGIDYSKGNPYTALFSQAPTQNSY